MSSLRETEDLAFAPGADLWILPDRSQSAWAAQVDWYLNFQIGRAEKHESQPLPSQVQNILELCELRGYDWKGEARKDPSLMVWASPFVPARWVLTLPDGADLAAWASQAVRKWKSLNQPSIRIFLPQNTTENQFRNLWLKAGGTESVTLIAAAGVSKNG